MATTGAIYGMPQNCGHVLKIDPGPAYAAP